MLTLPLLFFPLPSPSVYVISTRHRRSRKIRNNCNKGGIYNRYCWNTKRFIIFPLLYTSSVLTSNFFFCNTGRIAHLSLQFHRNSMNGNGDIGEKC